MVLCTERMKTREVRAIMNQISRTLSDVAVGSKEIVAARMAFFIPGFAMSTWAPMIPIVKTRLNLDADILGILLLCIGISALAVMPVSSMLARRFGCQKTIIAGSLVSALGIVLLSCMDSVWAYIMILLLFGAALGIADVTMNINAVIVEMAAERRLMSGMQAFWSIGCFAGAGCFALLAGLGLSAMAIALIHCFIILAIIICYGRSWLAYRSAEEKKTFAVPRGIVIILGIVTGITFLIEGAVMDWSGVLLTEAKHLDLSLAGTGYAVFSAAMLVMRLLGDKTIQMIAEKTVLLGGCILTAVGFAVLVWIDDLYLNGLSFILIGIGCANIVPIIYSMLKYQTTMQIGDAVAAISSLGYTGVILGPAFLGFIAQSIDINAVFELLVSLMLFEAALAKYIFVKLRA